MWLLFLMIGAALTGSIIGKYEAVLGTMTILTSFIPMIMNTGGNSGSQSATLIIRGLATGEVTLKDKFKVLRKEFGISLIVGIILASVNFCKNIFWDKVNVSVALTPEFLKKQNKTARNPFKCKGYRAFFAKILCSTPAFSKIF